MSDTKPKKLKLRSLAVDLQKEREGDWVPSRTLTGVSYHVKSPNTPEYRAAQSAAVRDISEKARLAPGGIDAFNSYATRVDLVLTHLLLGWSGMDEDYSPALAREILSDEAYRSLLEDIEGAAERVGKRAIERVEEDVKN